jgi:diguanylate cyclase (GGDEF)-like protein/PAS domain S-box-containing protein
MTEKKLTSVRMLGVAFAILIALLIGGAYLGLSRMEQISTNLNDVLGAQWTTLRLSRQALAYSTRNSQIAMEIFLLKDPQGIGPLLKKRAENAQEISELIKRIERLCGTPEDVQLLAAVEVARAPYVASYNRALHLLLEEHKPEAASAVTVQETTPALIKYHAAWGGFIQAQIDEVNKAASESRTRYSAIRDFVLSITALAVFLAISIAVITTRKIGQEMKRRIRAEREVRELNATLEQRVEERTRELFVANEQLSSEIAVRKAAQEQLQLQAAALDAAANSIVITDATGSILWVNPAFARLTGYSVGEVRGQDIRMLRSGKQSPSVFTNLWKTIASGNVWHGEVTNRRKDGSFYDVEMTVTPVRGDRVNISHYVAIQQDITMRKASEKALLRAEEKYRTIFENAVVGIFQQTPDGRPTLANPALAQLLGYDSPEQLVAEVSDVRQMFVNPNQLKELALALQAKDVANDVEVEAYSRNGSKKWLLANVCAVRGAAGNVVRQDGTVQDITQRKAAEEQVRYLAYYDALTGLPNRVLFQDRLTNALAAARRRREKVAVLFLDLDRFKTINDSLGLSVGDLVLKEIAGRLMQWVRAQDTVARFGSDEFVLVLTDVKDVSSVAVAADRLMKAMVPELLVQGNSLSVGCSIGISLFPDHGTDAETLVKNADAAMYCAKENGRNNFQFFTPDMNARAVERLALESSLRLALERKELFLEYQPQLNLATGRVIGAEALLRWRHPQLGLISPAKFIPIAENSGMIIPIGEWVLRTACTQARQWQEQGLGPLPVAVNVSAVQFRQDRFLYVVSSILDETGLAPQSLELELTESLLLSTAEVMLSMMRQLKDMGVKLSIDDFGTGYSNLSYLRHLPVYKLKIDRSFVQDLSRDQDDAAITATIINMAKTLNLRVIAEGVETEQQMQFLRLHGCDEVQGYYFSRPLSAGDFIEKARMTNLAFPMEPKELMTGRPDGAPRGVMM